jgi:hypothetical protein
MLETLKNKDNAEVKARVKKEIAELALAFPVPERFV